VATGDEFLARIWMLLSSWEMWRSNQTNNTPSSNTSCKVYWGWRWDSRTLIVKCKNLIIYDMIYDLIYLSTAIGLTHGGSGTVNICTLTIHRTTQLTTKQHE
jgi:hypothetical protein